MEMQNWLPWFMPNSRVMRREQVVQRPVEHLGPLPIFTYETLEEEARTINSEIARTLRSVGEITVEFLSQTLPGRLMRVLTLEYLTRLFRSGPVVTTRIRIPGIFDMELSIQIRTS